MKPILIATDYSPAAQHAADFAACLAKTTGAPLLLFHAWTIPAMSGEAFAMPVGITDLEKDQQRNVEQEAQRISKKWNIMPESLQSAGFAPDEIDDCCKTKNAGLVVMGIHHRKGVEKLMGSVAADFTHKTTVPLLIVPEEAVYTQPKKILFATDLHSGNDWRELDAMKEIAEFFHCAIHVLQVVDERHIAGFEESKAGIHLEHILKNISHSWHFPEDGDVVHGIERTAKEIAAEWIAIVPHHLPWLQQVFHRSISKQLAKETSLPMLVLPEHHAELGIAGEHVKKSKHK